MWKCSSYAGMMELVDMRDLGDVTSVKVFSFYLIFCECSNKINNSRRYPPAVHMRAWWNWQTRMI